MARINAYQIDQSTHQVSLQTKVSRKNFQLQKKPTIGEPKPLAAESFSINPDLYHTLMNRVDTMLRKD
jgi:hypothetical protein